jgi:hypothetical protein
MGDREAKQQDIRKWIGSPRGSTSGTPARRRRVISTSDSEADNENRPFDQTQVRNHIDVGNQQVPAPTASDVDAPKSPEVIHLATTSEDSMYVPCSFRIESGGAAQPAERNNHRMRTRAQHIDQRGSSSSVGNKRSRKTRPIFSAEAEETSNTGSSSADCIESDTDAQNLYRQAIAGVRNAGNARSNHRRSSMHCPVCAKFAAYLQHFL